MDHLDGMKYCLELIENIRNHYNACGYKNHDLPMEKVMADIENEIGIRAFRDWKFKRGF